MKVTYINHSGFLLEWEHCYWLFDYDKGTIPELNPEKELFVFCSHSHSDHYNPVIYELAKSHPSVHYIFANEVKKAYRKEQKHAEKELPEVLFLHSGSDTEITDQSGNVMKIHALHSTDCGCGFVLNYEGKTVYHAGDLHWWTWPGEAEAENRKMAADYRKEIGYLAGKCVDFVFTPLDPRQEGDYALGMNYLLEQVEIKHVFPMHFWDDFSIMEKYLAENQVPERTAFHQIVRDGQSWELD